MDTQTLWLHHYTFHACIKRTCAPPCICANIMLQYKLQNNPIWKQVSDVCLGIGVSGSGDSGLGRRQGPERLAQRKGPQCLGKRQRGSWPMVSSIPTCPLLFSCQGTEIEWPHLSVHWNCHALILTWKGYANVPVRNTSTFWLKLPCGRTDSQEYAEFA